MIMQKVDVRFCWFEPYINFLHNHFLPQGSGKTNPAHIDQGKKSMLSRVYPQFIKKPVSLPQETGFFYSYRWLKIKKNKKIKKIILHPRQVLLYGSTVSGRGCRYQEP